MDISLFRRGIRLPRALAAKPVEEMPPPQKAVILLRQTGGSVYQQTTGTRETLKIGDTVARSAAGDELHAPISGQIKAARDLPIHDGTYCKALEIESDGGDEEPDEVRRSLYLSSENDEILERVRKAGVVQAGRNARPLADLIDEAKKSGEIRHLVIRFSDPDPYAGSLEAVTSELERDSGDLACGVDFLRKLTGAKKIHFALEKEQRAEHVEQVAAEKNAAIHRFDAFLYPSLADELVALEILGRDSDIMPNQVHKSGVFIADVDTLLDTAAAVKKGVNVTSKTITVVGPNGARALKVRIGTFISDIIDALGEKSDWGKVVLGGPLLGRASHSLDLPLTKDFRSLTLQTSEQVSMRLDRRCFSCGLCSMVCPMKLIPGALSKYCERGDFGRANQAGLFSCIECGSCAYVCPSGRSMVELFSRGKNELHKARQEQNS